MASAWGDTWGSSWGHSWGVLGPPSGGKGDNDSKTVKKRAVKNIFKPTGLVDRPIRVETPAAKPRFDDVELRLPEQPAQAGVVLKPISEMLSAEIDAEIGFRLKEIQRKRQLEDEALLIILSAIH